MKNGAAIGERLFELRDARGWSQKELAKRSGISHTTIVHLETGQISNPRMPTLRKLARTFGMSAEEFANTDWADAVRQATMLRAHAKDDLEEALDAWEEDHDPAHRAEAGRLLQTAYDAVTALWNSMSFGEDEWKELTEAQGFYRELLSLVEGAGLHVYRAPDRIEVQEAA